MKFITRNRYWSSLFFALAGLFLQLPAFGQEREEDLLSSPHNFRFSENPDSAFLSAKDLYQQAMLAENTIAQGVYLNRMGEICYHQGHFARSLKYYLDAKKKFEKGRRKDLLADNYNKTGILHYYNRDTSEARKNYERAMQLFSEVKDQQGVAVTLGQIGHLMEKSQHYDSAILYQKKALAVYTAAGNEKGMARIYDNLGSIQEDLAHYDSAFHYFRTALDHYRTIGDDVASIEVINNLGDIYRKTGQLQKALEQSSLALELALKHKELYQISSAYRDLSKTYNLLGKNDSAFYYAEIARQYLLEIYSAEGTKQLSFLKALEDTESKNEEIKNLQNAKRVNIILTISILIIVLLLVWAGLLIISRQRIRLGSEKEKNLREAEIFHTQKRLMETDLKAAALEEEKLKTELRNKQLEREKLDAELRHKASEENQLKQAIEIKSKELSTQVLHVIQKNQLLEGMRVHLEEMVKEDKRDQKKQLKQLIQQINQNFNNDGYWDDFNATFGQIHQSFFEQLHQRFPDLTATDLKLVSLLKMNMDSADMATMLGISQDSLRVARYRLRKKLNMDQGANLVAFLQSIR